MLSEYKILCRVFAALTVLMLVSPPEATAAAELPPLNSRGVIGLRWGNTLRQIQEGMRRNQANRTPNFVSLPEQQVQFIYSGNFFDNDGEAVITLYKGKLWHICFVYPNNRQTYDTLLSLLVSQYGEGTLETEESGKHPTWVSGSTQIQLIKDDASIRFSWLDIVTSRHIRQHPGAPAAPETREGTEQRYIHKIPYQYWEAGEGLNAPFSKKGDGIFGLRWGETPDKIHITMSSRNRSVFRGRFPDKQGEVWRYSGPIQGKYTLLELRYQSQKLQAFTLCFPNESLQVERLFNSMLREFLSPPLLKNDREIWYYKKTCIIAFREQDRVRYNFFPEK